METHNLRHECRTDPRSFCYRAHAADILVFIFLIAPVVVALVAWFGFGTRAFLEPGTLLLAAVVVLLQWSVGALWWWGVWDVWSIDEEKATMEQTWLRNRDAGQERSVYWPEATSLRVRRSAFWWTFVGGGLGLVLEPVRGHPEEPIGMHFAGFPSPALAVAVLDEFLSRVPSGAVHPDVLILRDMVEQAADLANRDHRSAAVRRALCMASEVKLVRAVRGLRRSQARDDVERDEQVVMIQALYLSGRLTSALAAAQQYLKRDPVHQEVRLCCGMCLARLLRLREAQRILAPLGQGDDVRGAVIAEYARSLR